MATTLEQTRYRDMIAQLTIMEKVILYLVASLGVINLIFAIHVGLASASFGSALASAGIATAVTFAAATAGGLLGFLFGVPRLVPREAPGNGQPLNGDKRGLIDSNSNLEQISDWLTKIIVGIGLVQLNRVPDALTTYAGYFTDGGMFAVGSAVGASHFFVSLSIVGLGLGFVAGYVETRTRITSVLLSQEGYNRQAGATDAQFQEAANREQFATIDPKAKSTVVDVDLPKPLTPSDADLAVVKTAPSQIDTVQKRAARAAAFARLGNYTAAEGEWKQALTDPEGAKEPEYFLRLAEVFRAQGKFEQALEILQRAKNDMGDDYRILRAIVFVGLYIEPPTGFRASIDAGSLIMQEAGKKPDAMAFVWIAAANGQKARWLAKNGGSAVELGECRSAAETAIRKVLELAPDPNMNARLRLRQMLNPGTEGGSLADNDLASFQSDKSITDLIMQ